MALNITNAQRAEILYSGAAAYKKILRRDNRCKVRRQRDDKLGAEAAGDGGHCSYVSYRG